MKEILQGPALLFRAGGYWWDGTTWHRPAQVWDSISGEYYRRRVAAAATVTAADLLGDGGNPAEGKVLTIEDVQPGEPPAGRWQDDLALWAQQRDETRPLSESVVNLTAPELDADQMVGAVEVVDIARGEGSVPAPQATINGRSVWARPVVDEWAEARSRSSEGLIEAVSGGPPGSAPPGITEMRDLFTDAFYSRLREIAKGLSSEIAGSLDRLIPTDALASTIGYAFLHELRWHQDGPLAPDTTLNVTRPVAQMLGWLVRHDPAKAGYTISTIIREAEREAGIPRRVSENSVRQALTLDGKLDQETLGRFLARVSPPDAETLRGVQLR